MHVWVNVWGTAPTRRSSIGLVALAIALTGCIDDFDDPKGYGGGSSSGFRCADFCVEYVKCSDAPSERECQMECARTERIVRQADCERPYEDLLECFAVANDVCSASEYACSGEIDDFSACYSDACASNPDFCSY